MANPPTSAGVGRPARELPSGTLTLLFTDIEGSTRLVRELGERYATLLREHHRLLGEACQAWGGQEVDSQGDAAFYAFPRAADAVRAAIEVQRAFEQHGWPDGGPVRIRVALHTGEPKLSGGDYVGLDVHRAARLCALGHGGQILLSQATAELARDALPPGVTLRDLGEYHLKDFPRSERVCQLVAPDLQVDFPPLRTKDGRPSPSGEATPEEPTPAPVINGSGAAGERLASPDAPEIQVSLLGRFRVEVRGQPVPEDAWRRRKARQLFKCLLTRPRRRLSKDEAIELLWPESDPEAGATNLRSAVHAIRRALGEAGLGSDADLLTIDRDTVSLTPTLDIWLDADAFEQTLAQARSSGDALPLLEQANALYGGDYLPDDLYEDWATERRETLRRLWTGLQLSLARQSEAAGEVDAAASALQRLLQADPCDERAGQELMRLYARHGRRADALRAYQRLVQSLRSELDAEPSDETAEVQRQVIAGEVAAARPPPVAFTPFVCSYPFPEPEQVVGRQTEQAALGRLLDQGSSSGQVALVGGPAGTGKSTLVGALARQASQAGVLCLAGGSYEQEGIVPLGPFQDALADYLLAQSPEQVRAELGSVAPDLARVVPELRRHLDLPESPANASGTERVQLFGAVHACLRRLAERGRVLLCLEDLHAADAASLQLMHYLARQMRRLPLVIVATYRTEEVLPGQALAQLLSALKRERLAEQVRLGPFDRSETAGLVGALLDGPASQDLVDSLYAATEGNPLFVEQLVLARREEGLIEQRAGLWHLIDQAEGGIPTIIREVIGQRLERLSAHCRETIAMAAVLGQTVQHASLVAALPATDEPALLADLEEALEAYVLRETANGYTFGHTLLRETVYWSLSAPRRMLLHARAGETLECLAGPRANEQAAELAHHFVLAGSAPTLRAKTLQYSLEAGRRAAEFSSHREALAHFRRACDLIEHQGDEASPAVQLEALEGRGSAERQLAMWSACIATFRHVLELTDEPVRRALARAAIGYALQGIGDTATTLAECDIGLSELETAEAGHSTIVARLRLQYMKGYVWFLSGRFQDLLPLGQEMLRVATEVGQPRLLFWAHAAVAWAYEGLGQVDRSLPHFELAREAAAHTGDKVDLAIAQQNLGVQYYYAGQFAKARVELDRAVALYRDSAGDLPAVNSIQRLSRVWLAEGDIQRAHERADLALALALEAHDRWLAHCYDALGAIQALRCEWEAAEESFRLALQHRERVKHAAGQVDSLVGLGLIQQRRGDWTYARDLYSQAVEVAKAMDPSPWAVLAQRHLGRLLHLMGEKTAVDELEGALALAETMPQSGEYAPTRLALAEIRWRGGDPVSASEHAEQALAAGLTAELRVEAHILLADLHRQAEKPDQARAHAAEIFHLAERIGYPRLRGLAHLAAGRLEAEGGDLLAARASFEAALPLVKAARVPYEHALVLQGYAEAIALDSNLAAQAYAMLEQALDLFRQVGARPAAAACKAWLGRLRG